MNLRLCSKISLQKDYFVSRSNITKKLSKKCSFIVMVETLTSSQANDT